MPSDRPGMALPAPQPVIRYRRAADHRSHAQRWRDPVADFSRAEFPVRRLFLGLPRPEFLA